MRTSLALIVFAFGSVGLLSSQAPELKKPSIEVASIKPNNSVSRGSSTNTNRGSLNATNVTVRSLILLAYSISDFQLVGAPDWVSRETFDIQAKSDADPDAKPNPRGLIQALLEDRFQLKVHSELRELPVLLLTVAKGGLKIQQTRDGPPGPDGLAPGSSSTTGSPTGLEMKGRGLPLAELVRKLSPYVGRPIIDKTNLNGAFDFTLRFSKLPESPAPAIDFNSAAEAGPDIFTAVREQLGLTLDGGKGPVEVLVVDSVQKPAPN